MNCTGRETLATTGTALCPGRLDETVEGRGIPHLAIGGSTPTANAHCERLIGRNRCKCLRYLIQPNTSHLRRTLYEWVSRYNTGRPGPSLGPGIRYRIRHYRVLSKQSAPVFSISGVTAKAILRGLIASMNEQSRLELLDGIVAEDRGRTANMATQPAHENYKTA